MSEIKINAGDSFELALKRFNCKVQQAGILSEARRRRHDETRQARRKWKAEVQRADDVAPGHRVEIMGA